VGKKRHITVTGKCIQQIEYFIWSCNPESSSSLRCRESEDTQGK